MDSPITTLNPLLRLAAISGVETAIKLHIRRGDYLDARDGAGATPLILAAARRRKGAVRLLLDAGANPTLTDEKGMDAMAHAIKGGCAETIAFLTEALARFSATEASAATTPAEDISEPTFAEIEGDCAAEPEDPHPTLGSPLRNNQPAAVEIPDFCSPSGEVAMMPTEESCSGPTDTVKVIVTEVLLPNEACVLSLDDEPLNDFFVDAWVAEEENSTPEGDETVAEAAKQVHEAIGRHKVVDRDEDWGDVDLHLPVRAAPLARDKEGGAIRDLLLAAMREGMVSENRLFEVCSNVDGSRNEEAERLLAFVAGELGATIVEWSDSDKSFLLEPTMEEDRLLTEAVEFTEELASGRNDPLRFYAKDIRGDRLDAEEEIALGREMEEAGRAALSALALWPEGLSAVLDAAARVASGEAEVETFSAGPEPSPDDEPVSNSRGTGDDENDEYERNEEVSFFVNAAAAVEAARGDALRVTEALEEARLTRGFLMELADKAGTDHAGRAFVDALGRQAKARERMILCNLRLALYIAKRHLWSGIPLDDLVQEANIGLMKAVERFDWRKGFRFSTYATWWIRQQVSRWITNTSRVVRAPVHIQETARKVLRERQFVEARIGRPETNSETARRIGMPLAKTQMLIAMFAEVDSLDEVEPDTGLSRADSIIDEITSDPADVAERASLRSTLFRMLADQNDRAREVILLRFGFMDDEAMTLEEVGQRFGVTRERIRQIESKTIRWLSHENRREILWSFIGDGCTPSNVPLPEQTRAEASSSTDKEHGELSETAVEREEQFFSASRDQAQRIADEARALGLKVEDHRAQGAS